MTTVASFPTSKGSANSVSEPLPQIAGAISANEKLKFSPTGQELAITTHDGRMTIWDAQTRQIKHQYIPSKHHSAVCTCLSWMPLKDTSCSNVSRKRKTSTSSLTNGNDNSPSKSDSLNSKIGTSSDKQRSDTIALGTLSGSILIYSLKNGDVVSQYSKESAHNGRVNDIAWNSGSSEIFSCSLDGFICQIDIKASKLMSKFHANHNDTSSGKTNSASRKSLGRGREPLHSICLHPTERSVIVGSLSRLTWMDLDTKSPLKTLEGGHVGVVTSLTVLQMYKQCYILSAGESSDDYTITAWKLSLEGEIDPQDKEKLKKQTHHTSSDS